MISMAGVLCRLSDHFPVQLEKSGLFYQAFYALYLLSSQDCLEKV